MKPFLKSVILPFAAVALAAADLSGQTNAPFDGSPWNISTGNLSVLYIQASPIGGAPRPGFFEPPPPVETETRLKRLGLVANEDYIAWGAVEREPNVWSWQQHDTMEKALHAAGLKYVVYDWVHFPPLWLREEQKDQRTLMRCLEHDQETYYLSIFDPRTIDWYDHFYQNLKEHFGNRIDDVYACILGPYGEGNYPLKDMAWINMGHCHEGYWCGDQYALKAFKNAMKSQYGSVKRLNRAWGVDYRSFADVNPPKELADEKFKPSPAAFPTPQDKRRWLDFITWYHQAIIDFSEQSVKTVLKYFPAEKVRMKPGGNAIGVNPLAWGTYCPGYAKMARNYPIVLQPADCQGAVFGDKWMGTAYQFYHVKESTEPASALDDKRAFNQRMFSDADAGASQFFTYEFEQHVGNIQKYVHLMTGKPGETEIAVYCPTTLYRLGENLKPSIDGAYLLRDAADFNVLDELLIADGALTTNRYKTLLMFQGEIIDEPILKKIDAFMRDGGKVIAIGDFPIANVEGRGWMNTSKVARISPVVKRKEWQRDIIEQLTGCKGVDGKYDGLWTCRRGAQVFVFNATDKPIHSTLDGEAIVVEPRAIFEHHPK